MTNTNDERINNNDQKIMDMYYNRERQPKIKVTKDWDERVVQAVVTWFEVRMNEELRIRNKESNMFSLTDSMRLLMKEAPGVEAFFIKNGAEEFIKDEVEIIIGYETDKEIEERLQISRDTDALLK
jgi:hypothetical protein